MEIQRDRYLHELILRKHNGSIKVITGIRRAGKSYLLNTIFCNYLLKEGVREDHIIKIAFDNPKYDKYLDPKKFLRYIESCILDKDMYYILLDEVQLMEKFEGPLNGLLYIDNVDVYVTGSNSKFLSKDVITEFRGRGDEVHIYPLSFAEFMSVYEGSKFDGWNEYTTYGGLPGVILRSTYPQKTKYLQDLFKETYMVDIINRNGIKNTAELETLVDILSSSIGSLTNPKRITDTFLSVQKTSISAVTVKSYLDYLEDAFIICGVKRFDVRGRKYIGSPLKYYFEDVGIRNARLNFRQQEETYLMENIIYNELRMRGFSVDVGVVEKKELVDGKSVRKYYEIDFVCSQGSQKYYIQSALSMPTPEKVEQEKHSLLNTKDNFKKIIVVKDYIMLKRDEDGITTMNIFDLLLDEHSLER